MNYRSTILKMGELPVMSLRTSRRSLYRKKWGNSQKCRIKVFDIAKVISEKEKKRNPGYVLMGIPSVLKDISSVLFLINSFKHPNWESLKHLLTNFWNGVARAPTAPVLPCLAVPGRAARHRRISPHFALYLEKGQAGAGDRFSKIEGTHGRVRWTWALGGGTGRFFCRAQ